MNTYTIENTPNTVEFRIEFEELNVRLQRIRTLLGYDADQAPSHVEDELEHILKRAGELCNIRGGYRIIEQVELDTKARTLAIDHETLHVERIVSRQLRQLEQVAIFVCTIGPEFETWSKQLMESGDLVKGYLVDAIASETVDLAMDLIQNALDENLQSSGLRITNRYSPGYCNWNVSEQQKLFSFLPPSFCGISLKPSSLMIPIKSVSGIIGIGKDVKQVDYTCRFCEMDDCLYKRRARMSAASEEG